MKLFKVTTTIPKPVAQLGNQSEFVDWYEAETLNEARAIWDEDCNRYGLPKDVKAVWIECDPKTLKPIEREIVVEPEGSAWSWRVMNRKHILAGGYCRTQADAQNDAEKWIELCAS